MKIAFGNDHAGFSMRDVLLSELKNRGHEVLDLGAQCEDSVDYPDFAKAVCEAVTSGKADFGVLCCGTGVGISIAANKIRGIRCSLVTDEFGAEMSRRHNNANVLALRGREFDAELNRKLMGIWLENGFDGGERHERRVRKISEMESC